MTRPTNLAARNQSSLPKAMRAFATDRLGDPGRLRQLPVPEIGPDEMLARVRAAGVNPLDLKIRDGGKAALTSLKAGRARGKIVLTVA